MWRNTFWLLPLLAALTNQQQQREHKVHNIILYPDKFSWCQTTPIQQIVASPGYEPVTIDNNVCVGACYSYTIPRTQPAEPGEVIGPYCDSCQPVETKCYHVNLKSQNSTRTFQKRVQIITNCSCTACDKIHHKSGGCDVTDEQQNTLELPSDMFSTTFRDQPIVDEVPELLINHNEVGDGHLLQINNNSKLLGLIDLNSLDELENELTSKNGVKKINKAQMLIEKHRDFGLEGVVTSDNHSHHHHHHLGEEMRVATGAGHLIKGPHGSMVLAPNLNVEEKLNVDSDVLKLKPNHDGVVISYEDMGDSIHNSTGSN